LSIPEMTRPKLLLITFDPKIARQVGDLASRSFAVLYAKPESLDTHLRTEGDLEVFIADDGPTSESIKAVRLLEHAQERRPSVRRVLLTDYGDVGAVVRAVHDESAQFVLHRPVVPAELLAALALGRRADAVPPTRPSGAAA
jgi:DNA-binding NtrC family response regulator